MGNLSMSIGEEEVQDLEGVWTLWREQTVPEEGLEYRVSFTKPVSYQLY
jgi:hypothetical protein